MLLLQVEYSNDESKSTISYTITPKKNLTCLFDEFPKDKINMFYGIGNLLYMGDIMFMPELNTVNELGKSDEHYDINNDNSRYIDYIATDYTMEVENKNDGIMTFLSALGTISGTVLNSFLGGFPASEILSILLSAKEHTIISNGNDHNSDAYEEQIKKNQLETSCIMYFGEDKFLSRINEDKLSFTIKYDNKLHTKRRFSTRR